jgi:hypothetical protein
MPLSPTAMTRSRWIAPDEARAGSKVRTLGEADLVAAAAITSA